jgi:hypothetical protein
MRHWALVANPDIYEIDRAIREISEDRWTTKGRPIEAGDRVAIWRAKGRRRWIAEARARGHLEATEPGRISVSRG